jgi:hypothetical protein
MQMFTEEEPRRGRRMKAMLTPDTSIMQMYADGKRKMCVADTHSRRVYLS